jgi:hypothetical protein
MKHFFAILLLIPLLHGTGCDSSPGAGTAGDPPPDGGEGSVGSVVVEELALGDLEVVRVDAEAAYRSVGLRWDALAGTSVSLVARARLLDGTWTAWSPVDGFWEESSAHNGRWAPPGAADAFELKGGRGLLSHLVVELLAAGQPQAADGDGTATRAQALAPESLVNSRESWGAAPGTCTQVLPLHTPSRITIHHTVTPTYDTLGTAARLRQIQSYHQVVRGWCDIGYHFLVSRDGQLWQGAPDELRQGIHTANANDGNVGIAFLGNYETDQPTTTSLVGAQGLIQWLSDTYGIALDDQHLLGHLDHPTASTLCPGKHLYARLSELRDPATPPTAPPPATVSGTLCPGVGILSCGECSDPIDIEGDYLPHVVQCENGGADFEALKAQAIAARSYLYYALGSGSIQDSQAGQVYSCNATPGPQHIAAVAETTGLVLVNEYDATIAAFYVAGAKPSTPDCVALPSDPDPTNTEGWVTYQVPGSPVVPTPLGSLTNPKNRGCMSQKRRPVPGAAGRGLRGDSPAILRLHAHRAAGPLGAAPAGRTRPSRLAPLETGSTAGPAWGSTRTFSTSARAGPSWSRTSARPAAPLRRRGSTTLAPR